MKAAVCVLGAVLAFPAAAGAQSIIYAFHGTTDGSSPEAGLIPGQGGVLYGTADEGGLSDNGTIYSLTPPAGAGQPWIFKVLWRLRGGTGGGYPLGLVQDPSGNLYGYAFDFGAGYGIVFRLETPISAGRAWRFQTLYQFQGGADGAYPSGLARQPDGTLIGTTDHGGGRGPCRDEAGGNLVGCGTIYQLSPPAKAGGAWTETILHRFEGGSDGAIPVGNPLSAGGALYGVTTEGGGGSCTDSDGTVVGCGSVYRLVQATQGDWSEGVPFAFQGGSLGATPIGGLASDTAGNLYGAASAGGIAGTGSSGDSNGNGVVYELSPSGGGGLNLTILHQFAGSSDGYLPQGGVVVDGNGNVYGTTYLGTASHLGSVFRLTPPATAGGTWQESVLASFGGSKGAYPSGQLAIGGNGALYGVTIQGGRFDAGVVYSVVP